MQVTLIISILTISYIAGEEQLEELVKYGVLYTEVSLDSEVIKADTVVLGLSYEHYIISLVILWTHVVTGVR